jgi:aryl-phospho-beta-D-glucosidase BglC (GH1 family)
MNMLQVQKDRVVDAEGKAMVLRGTCIGGWMNMENFINGYPGAENGIRSSFAEILGRERAEFFFNRLLDYFLSEEDIAFLKKCGSTVVRLPLNYRHFEDDADPFQYREGGFTRLDRVLDWCEKNNLYAILDLHAVPGSQNSSWHSDNSSRHPLLWVHRHFQDRLVELWKEFARRYKERAVIAGYNLMNEPYSGELSGRFAPKGSPNWDAINRLYRRLVSNIREIDPYHIIFLEGDYYSLLFDGLEEPFAPNLIYSSHNYNPAGFGPGTYPGEIGGEHWDRRKQEDIFKAHEGTRYVHKYKVPILIGEFGSVYNGPEKEVEDRLRALDDQLDVFEQYGAHWTTWTYKDIGVMGWVMLDPESEYMERIRPVLKMKQELYTDFWMKWLPATKAKIMVQDLTRHIHSVCGQPDTDLGALEQYLVQAALSGFTGTFLQPAMARLFRSLSEEKMDEILSSFAFRKCIQNEGLLEVVRKHSIKTEVSP